MPNPVQLLFAGGVPSPATQIIYGEVSYNQPLPRNFSDPLYVVIPDVSTSYYYVVTSWPACNGTSLPKAGAECMLIRDVRQVQTTLQGLRCIWWEGPTEFIVAPVTGDRPTGTIYLFPNVSSTPTPPLPPGDWAMWSDATYVWGQAGTAEWDTAFVYNVSDAPKPPSPAPNPPTNVTAVASNAQATVSWTAPSSGVVTSYTVTARVAGSLATTQTITGSPPQTSTIVTGLTNGTTYTFTVSASNAGGSSAQSTPSNAVTPQVSSIPIITSISPNSGLTTGGTAVTITGFNLSNPTGVTFGGTPATGVSGSAISAQATSPAHAVGAVNVDITTVNGTSAHVPGDLFTYTSTVPSGTAYDTAVANDSPVMYITNSLTATVGSYTAQNHNSVTQVAMPDTGLAWSFNSSGNQYLSIPDPSNGSLSIGSSGGTLEFWMRLAATAQPHGSVVSLEGGLEAIGKSDYSGAGCEYCWRYYGSDTHAGGNAAYDSCFYRFSPSCGVGDGFDDHIIPKTAGTWYYCLGRYNGSGGTVQIDLRAHGSSTWASNSAPGTTHSGHTTTPFTIGACNVQAGSGDASFFYGAIGKVAFYNKVLTNAQRDAHFTAMP